MTFKHCLWTRGPKGHISCTWLQCATFASRLARKILVKFSWILFSSFRKVKNIAANQRQGQSSWFSDRPEKHKLGRGHWDIASCQVSLNCVQQFQWRSETSLSQSEAGTAILFFWSARNLEDEIKNLPTVKFCWIPFSSFRGEVKNVSEN